MTKLSEGSKAAIYGVRTWIIVQARVEIFAMDEEEERMGREEEIDGHIHQYIISQILQVLSLLPRTVMSRFSHKR